MIARDESRQGRRLRDDLLELVDAPGGAIAVMNDLFVAPAGRGGGFADALIGACVSERASAERRV